MSAIAKDTGCFKVSNVADHVAEEFEDLDRLHDLVLARHQTEWQVAVCAVHNFLAVIRQGLRLEAVPHAGWWSELDIGGSQLEVKARFFGPCFNG